MSGEYGNTGCRVWVWNRPLGTCSGLKLGNIQGQGWVVQAGRACLSHCRTSSDPFPRFSAAFVTAERMLRSQCEVMSEETKGFRSAFPRASRAVRLAEGENFSRPIGQFRRGARRRPRRSGRWRESCWKNGRFGAGSRCALQPIGWRRRRDTGRIDGGARGELRLVRPGRACERNTGGMAVGDHARIGPLRALLPGCLCRRSGWARQLARTSPSWPTLAFSVSARVPRSPGG